MKKFTVLSKAGYKLMSDGVQEFNAPVVQAMDKIELWNEMAQSYMIENREIQFFISIGYNAGYFKSDGQQYCTHLHIATKDKCYLHSCLCSYRQKDIDAHIDRFINKVEELMGNKDGSFDFEKQFQEKLKSYPWQTSTPKN